MRVEQAQIEVARDAWQETEGAGDLWREMLKEHPVAIQNYIGKRFAKERDELAALVEKLEAAGKDVPHGLQPRFRITSLSYVAEHNGTWSVTDNTPGE